jgi:hypothetical protein
MVKHRIAERDAAALLKGQTPAGRPDLAPLADSFMTLRAAAFRRPPRPSVELALRLGLTAPSSLADARTVDAQASTRRGAPKAARARRTVSWVLGLGLATKIVVGVSAGALAVTGAGAAGVLPLGTQDAFDTVVSVVVPSLATQDEPIGTVETGDKGTVSDEVVTPNPSSDPLLGDETVVPEQSVNGNVPATGTESTQGDKGGTSSGTSGTSNTSGSDTSGKSDKTNKKDTKASEAGQND